MSTQSARARFGADRTSLYDEITTKIIEAGRVPWVQPWGTAAAKAPLGMPKNAATGRLYSGINVLILWGSVIEHGFPVQGWVTFRQALSLGGNVRKGERGTTVVYADRFIPDEERKRAHETGEEPQAIPFLKRFTVFNLAAVKNEAQMRAQGHHVGPRTGINRRPPSRRRKFSQGPELITLRHQAAVDIHRLNALNFPNPGSDTSAPLAAASTIFFKMSSTIDLACALLRPCVSVSFATSSNVFTAEFSSRFGSGRLCHGSAAMLFSRCCSIHAGLPRRHKKANTRRPIAGPCNEWRLS